MSSLPEVCPTVSVDAALADLVSDISVDFDALTAKMREMGFSDAQILETTIQFSDRSTMLAHRNTTGIYDSRTGLIQAFLGIMIEDDKLNTPKASPASIHARIPSTKVRPLNDELTRTVVHELGHHRVEVVGEDEQLTRDWDKISYRTLQMGIVAAAATNASVWGANILKGSLRRPLLTAGGGVLAGLIAGVLTGSGAIRFAHRFASPDEDYCQRLEDENQLDLATVIVK